VANILIFSNNPRLTANWTHILIGGNSVSMLQNIKADFIADAILIDAGKLDEDANLMSIFANQHNRFLVIGSNWPEQKQIEVLVRGAAGYLDDLESAGLLERAVQSILNGDIWIRRSLVPKVIEALTNVRPFHGATTKSTNIEELIKMFNTLSIREREVADMIQIGENNKRIALELNITERTVKAHLSSIFKKLNVDDRLHLAIFLKEIEQYRNKFS
jgi:DNA-binding NarL/FixJ family response regulator